MNIEETQSTIKITKASVNFVKCIKELPWQLIFWEAVFKSHEIFHTHIESNGVINDNEIYKMAENCAKELETNDEDIQITFTLYFLKGDKK